MRTSSTADQAAWERLGRLLEQRREQMHRPWRKLTQFTRDRDIDYRVAWDLEHGRRTNYRQLTIAAVEVAYGWAPGSVASVLRGGDPEPAAGSPGAGKPDDDPRPAELRDLITVGQWADPRVQELWAVETFNRKERAGLIVLWLRAQENDREAAEVTDFRRRAAR